MIVIYYLDFPVSRFKEQEMCFKLLLLKLRRIWRAKKCVHICLVKGITWIV